MQYRTFDNNGFTDDSFRAAEADMLRLFSVKQQFSEHLSRWIDDELPDKYDHNFFEYTAQPSQEEFQAALAFQKERGDAFIKLGGDSPLENAFGLTESATAALILEQDHQNWRRNPELSFGEPTVSELEVLELSQFGLIYGESFTRRNLRRLLDKFDFYGAYVCGELVGSCYAFSSHGWTCIDGLLVDIDHRRQGIATSLLAHVADHAAGQKIFLHADPDDEPYQMYLKLGFREHSRVYEYLCSGLMMLKLRADAAASAEAGASDAAGADVAADAASDAAGGMQGAT